jgi:flagellar motor switch protein FliM
MTGDNGQRSAPGGGLKHLIDAPKLAFDKAPVMQSVFDRFASNCADVMRHFCSAPCSFSLDGLSSGTTGDLLETYGTGLGAVFHSPEWDARILIGCDRRFALSMVEAMFGADGSEAPLEGDRPLTALECRVASALLIKSSTALQDQLEPVCRVTFDLERTDIISDCSTIGASDAPALMAQLIIQLMGGGGRLFVVIPNSALAPFRKRFERERPPEAVLIDPAWSRQLQLELGRAEVDLMAVLAGLNMSLDALSRLQPGQVLPLNATTGTPIGLEVENKTLFTAKLGQSKGFFTVCIDRRVDERDALLSDILGGQRTLS